MRSRNVGETMRQALNILATVEPGVVARASLAGGSSAKDRMINIACLKSETERLSLA
ncbi:MAG: hypothetical protein IPJ07_19235 [Acidobacteria bacterium]|nr:hypothetical protein [Acidobacteriota bacterium]